MHIHHNYQNKANVQQLFLILDFNIYNQYNIQLWAAKKNCWK